MVCTLTAPHMQELALISILAVPAGHVVAANISLRAAVHDAPSPVPF